MDSPALTLHALPPGFGPALARELVAGLDVAQRAALLREMLPAEERLALTLELARDVTLYSAEEAGALAKWTGSGFLRKATQENCPHIRLGHKQPTLFRHRALAQFLESQQVWPKGRPKAEPTYDFAARAA